MSAGIDHAGLPPTPDFYHYPAIVPRSVEVDGRFVIIDWPDGTQLRAFDLWLLENAVGSTIDPATRESVLDPADLDLDASIREVSITEAGALRVSWHANHAETVYHPGWLHHVAHGRHAMSAMLPEPVPWRADEMELPPTHDGRAIGTDGEIDDAIGPWIEDLVRYGLARLSGVPLEPDLLLEVAGRLGAIRDTNFGPIWDVKADIDPNSTANTNFRLCPHTDLPTRETPPGFQFLHCLANGAAGGFSTMTDGLTVANHLAAEHPEHYEALTTLKWVFFNRSPRADHRWSGPIIDLGVDGSPLTLRAFHPVRGFPDMDDRDLPRAYAALRRFSEVAADPRFQLRYPFSPGDLVGFDNRRILHGRDAYESGGVRHLRGIYMDHDEVHSYLRQRARRTV